MKLKRFAALLLAVIMAAQMLPMDVLAEEWQSETSDTLEAGTYHTVTFLVEGETWDTRYVQSGETLTLPSDPTKDGCEFTGWYYAGAKVEAGTPVTGDMTVEARFQELPTANAGTNSILSFFSNGGIETIAANATKTTIEIVVGGTYTISGSSGKDHSWKFRPNNGSYKDGLTLSNEKTQTVTVTGVKAGTYTLTHGYKSQNTNESQTYTVIVTSASLTGLTISGDSTVIEGKTITLTALPTPSGATANLEWSSSDGSILTVDQNGVVTGVSAGIAMVTAKDTTTNVAATHWIVVNAIVALTALSISGPGSMGVSETIQLTAVKEPDNAADDLTWSSSDNSVLTVDQNGVVTTKKTGVATVTVTNGNGVSATKEITVTAGNWVYVYTKVTGNTEGLVVNNSGWYTLGRVFVPGLPAASQNYTVDASKWNSTVIEAAKGSGFLHEYNKGVSIANVDFSLSDYGLKTANGANDYSDTGYQWHLDGSIARDYLATVIYRYHDEADNSLRDNSVGEAHTVGDTVTRTTADAPAITGYTCYEVKNSPLSVSESTTYYIDYIYSKNVYTVIYNLDGGKWSSNDHPYTYTKNEGATVTVLSDEPQKTGYTFKCWTSSDVEIQNGSFTMPGKNVTLTAQWEKDENATQATSYTVQHMVDGEVRDTQTYTSTAWVNETNPKITIQTGSIDQKTYDGYKYDSISLSVEVGSEVASGTTITLTYVKRTDLSYTVNYLEQGTNKALSTAKVVENQTFGASVTENAIDIAGYDKVESTSKTFTITAETNIINFYYTAKTYNYTVNYVDESGYTIKASETKSAAFNSTVTAESEKVDIDGYTYKQGDDITINGSSNVMTLVYTANTGTVYTVEHYQQDLNGEGYTLKDTDNLKGATGADVTAVPKDYPGFTYDATVPGTVASGTVAADGSLVLKLYYTRNSYTVTYQPGDHGSLGGAEGNIDHSGLPYGIATPAAPVVTPNEGYVFTGWSPLPAATVTGNAVYVAQYAQSTDQLYYTVNYYRDSIGEGNLLHREIGTGEVGNPIPYTNGAYLPVGYVAPGFVTGQTTITENGEANVLNVVYGKNTNLGYTVNYYKDSIAPGNLLGSDRGTGAMGDPIPYTNGRYLPAGYVTPGAVSGQTFITTEPDNNVRNVVYGKNTNLGYTVKYYQDEIKDGNIFATVIGNGTLGETIPYSIEEYRPFGYAFEKLKGQTTITANPDKNVLDVLYKKRKDLTCTVNYLEQGTNKVLRDPDVTTEVSAGETVSREAKGITGYDKIDPTTVELTISENNAENVINFFYKIKSDRTTYTVYYLEQDDTPEDDSDNTVLHEPFVKAEKIGKNKDVYAEVIAGYEPDATRKTIEELDADASKNVITFYYTKTADRMYTVKYLEVGSDVELLSAFTSEAKYKIGEEIESSTITRPEIDGYDFVECDPAEKLTIGGSNEENVIKLYYKPTDTNTQQLTITKVWDNRDNTLPSGFQRPAVKFVVSVEHNGENLTLAEAVLPENQNTVTVNVPKLQGGNYVITEEMSGTVSYVTPEAAAVAYNANPLSVTFTNELKLGRVGYNMTLTEAEGLQAVPYASLGWSTNGESSQGAPKYRDDSYFYAEGDSIHVTSYTPSATGYVFLGWFDKDRTDDGGQPPAIREAGDSSGAVYCYKNGSDYTLDALWASLNAEDVEYTYDGQPHPCKEAELVYNSGRLAQNYVEEVNNAGLVQVVSREYSTSADGPYSAALPEFTDAGTYTVYVKGTVKCGGTETVLYTTATVTIKPRQVTLTSDPDTKVYDGTALTKPGVTIGGDGFVAGEVSGIKATGSVTNVSDGEVTNAITYVKVQGVFKDDNYLISNREGTLTIIPRDVTITVNSVEDITYDGEAHTVEKEANGTTYTYGVNHAVIVKDDKGKIISDNHVGLLEGDTLGNAAVVYDPANPVNAGTYAATVGDADAITITRPDAGDVKSNYHVIIEPGTLKINPKSVTVKAVDVTKTAGEDDPTFTATVTGKVNESDVIVYTLSCDHGESVGTYTITPDGEAAQGNYTVTYESGTLTITEEPTYTVTYQYTGTVPYGAPDAPTGSSSYKQNDTVNVAGKPTMTGYTLSDWSASNVTVTNGTFTMPAKDVTLEAQWTVNKHDIIYKVNDGEVKRYEDVPFGTNLSTGYGYEYTAPDGYAFSDWKETLPSTMPDADVVITATTSIRSYDYTVKYVWGETEIADRETGTAVFGSTQTGEAKDIAGYTLKEVTPSNSITIGTGTNEIVFHYYKNVTVTAVDASKVYGDKDPGLTATASDGLSISCTVARDSGEDVGSYTITPIGEGTQVIGGKEYKITYVDGILTITKRPITITADDGSKPYDGTPLTKNSSTVTNGSLVNDHNYTATVSGSITNVGETENVPSGAVIKDADQKDVTSNYDITYGNGELTITKRLVTVTGEGWSENQPYTGTEYKKTGYTFSNVVFGQTATITYSIKGTEVGEYIGTFGEDFTVMSGAENVTANYELTTKTPGRLNIVKSAIGGYVTLTPADVEKTYDGTTYTAGTATATDKNSKTVKIEYQKADGEWTEHPEDITATDVADSVTVNVRASVESSYEGYVNGTQRLTINPRNVILTSVTLEKEYDGTPLTNGENRIVVTGKDGAAGFVGNDGASYIFTGSQTLIGSSKNTFEFTLINGAVADNYDIERVEGDLTVTDRTEKYQITVEANSGTETYDGTAKSVSGFKTLEFTVNGQNYTVSGLEASATGINAGEYTANVTGTAVVKDSTGKDVTAQFTVTTTNGTLTINKRDVTFTGESGTVQWDGNPHTLTGITASVPTTESPNTGLVNGHTYEGLTYSATGTDLGKYDGAFTGSVVIKSGSTDVTENYNITKTPGTLTIGGYKVNHHLQKLDGSGYDLHATETKGDIPGNSTAATANTYEGFTAQAFSQKTIAEDGTTVVDIYYNRNSHSITYKITGSYFTNDRYKVIEGVKYGESLSLIDDSMTQEGYTFSDWRGLPNTMPDSDVEVTGFYTINSYNLTIHYRYSDGGEAANDHTVTLNYQVAYSVPSPTITGYTADQTVVSGTMPANHVEVTVTYNRDDNQKHSVSYRVDYYKDGTLAETGTVVSSGEEWIGKVTTVTVDSNKINTTNKYVGYRFEKTEPSSIPASYNVEKDAETGEVNVISVYYVKDDSQKHSVSYRVDYYKDGKLAETGTVVSSGEEWIGEVTTVTVDSNKINTTNKYVGYSFEKTEPSSIPASYNVEKDAETGEVNVISVYYVKDESATNPTSYTVKHVVGGTEQAADTETYNSTAWVNDNPAMIAIVDGSLAPKTYTGYKFSSVSVAEGTTQVESGTTITLTYVKDDSQTQATKYTVHYTIEGTERTGDKLEVPSTAWVNDDPAQIAIAEGGIPAPADKYAGYKLDTNNPTYPTAGTLVNSGIEYTVNYVKDSFGYTVNYYKDSSETDNLIIAETGTGIFGDSIPYTNGKNLPEGYVAPGTVSGQATITADANQNVLNVVYGKRTDLSYTVEYREGSATGTELETAKTETGKTFGDTYTETAKQINGYTVDAETKTVTMTTGENKIVFIYTKRADLGYTVNYYEKDTTTKVADSKIVENQTFQAEVTENAIDIAGYNKVAPTSQAITIGVEGNVINFYYTKRTDLSYTVHYYWNGTTQSVAADRQVNNCTFGDTYTEDVIPSIDGYTAVPVAGGKKSVTITTGVNEIIFNYYQNVTLTANSVEVTYDGKTHTVEGYTGAPQDVTFVGVTATGSGTDANSYPVSFSQDAVGKVDTTGKYIVKAANDSTLKINPKPVTVKADDQTKTYGEADPELTATTEGALGGDTVSYNVGRTAGEDVGTYTITPTGAAAQGNYTVTYKPGTLTITKKSIVPEPGDASSVTVEAPKDVKYNGESQQQKPIVKDKDGNTLTEGTDYTLSYSENTTDVGTVTVTVTGKGNYSGETAVTYHITKRVVTLTSEGASKVYDGRALTRPAVAVGGDGFVDGEVSDITATGTITNVGSVTNTITYTTGDRFQESNYTITKTEGTLTVTDRTEKYQITVEAKSRTEKYDGTEKRVSGLVSTSFTVDGNTYTVEGLDASATGINAGEYTANVTGTAVVKDSAGKDVTAQFTVSRTPGKLIITPDDTQVTVTITGNQDTKVYNGAEQSVTGYTTDVGEKTITVALKAGEEAAAKGTNVGYYSMGLTEDSFMVTSDNYSNIKVEVVDGYLEITPITDQVTVTITGNHGTKVYDGSEQRVTGFTTDVGEKTIMVALKEGEEAVAKGTNVGEYPMGLTKDDFTVTSDNYCNIKVEVVDGYLEITPITDQVTVTITGNQDAKVYDGSEHSVSGYEVTNISDPLYSVNDFSFSGTASASRKEVGKTDMGLADTDFSNTNENFSNVVFNVTDGYMEITPVTAEVVVTITGNQGTKVYDGTEQRVTGYEVKEISNPLYTAADFTFAGGADTAAGTDAGRYPMGLKPEHFRNENRNFSNVTFVVEDGSLTIAPRAVTLTSATGSKVYDGTALTNREVTVTSGSFADGEGVDSYNVTGSQLTVGSSENRFEYRLREDTKPGNYQITLVFGTLTVTDGGGEHPVDPDHVVTKTHEDREYGLGDTVTFTIRATNIYGEARDITITEQEGVTITGASKFQEVAPGVTVETTATYTIQEADILRGGFTNQVTAEFSGEKKFINTDDVPTEEKRGHLTITKGTTSTPANGEAYALGETISYRITATNDGNLTLTDVVVTDALTGGEWEIASLAPGESETFTTEYRVTEADILAGTVVNVATGKGTSSDPEQPEVPAEPGETDVPTEEKRGHLTITKETTGTPAKDGKYALNEVITYEITATNDGNLTLTNVVVTDDLTGGEWTIESLAPGESKTFTTEYRVTEADILAGTVVNVATGTAKSPDPEQPKVPADPGETDVPTEEKRGHLTITKETTGTPAKDGKYALNEVITYEITATNDGNLTLTNVVVTDDLTGGEWKIASLAPDESKTFTTEYRVTEADILAGKVVNVATGTAESPDPDSPNPDPEKPVPVKPEDVEPGKTEDETDPKKPHLTITKGTASTPANGEAYALGETIRYEITVTNDGNLTVADIRVTDILSSNEDNVIALIPSLAPGESRVVPFAYAVTGADLLAGTVPFEYAVSGGDMPIVTVRNLASAVAPNPDPDDKPDVPVTPGETDVPVNIGLKLTVRYWYDQVGGTPAANTVTGTYAYGQAYSVTSPRIPGFTADRTTVTGNLLEDTTVDVIYTQNRYTVTVQYRYLDGDANPAAPDRVLTGIPYGQEYTLESPAIPGWTANLPQVSGVMPEGDVIVTVFYRRTDDNRFVEIEEFDVPLGLGSIVMNVGDCIE